MPQYPVTLRLGLVILAALLALPLAPAASPVAAKPRLRTVTRTFGNTAAITDPSETFPESPEALTPTPPRSASRG